MGYARHAGQLFVDLVEYCALCCCSVADEQHACIPQNTWRAGSSLGKFSHGMGRQAAILGAPDRARGAPCGILIVCLSSVLLFLGAGRCRKTKQLVLVRIDCGLWAYVPRDPTLHWEIVALLTDMQECMRQAYLAGMSPHLTLSFNTCVCFCESMYLAGCASKLARAFADFRGIGRRTRVSDRSFSCPIIQVHARKIVSRSVYFEIFVYCMPNEGLGFDCFGARNSCEIDMF